MADNLNYSAKGPMNTDGREPDSICTTTLIQRIRSGDECAREQLFQRYLPLLQRWAVGRLPSHARKLADTDFPVREPAAFMDATKSYAELREALAGAEDEWLGLEILREELERQ